MLYRVLIRDPKVTNLGLYLPKELFTPTTVWVWPLAVLWVTALAHGQYSSLLRLRRPFIFHAREGPCGIAMAASGHTEGDRAVLYGNCGFELVLTIGREFTTLAQFAL